MKRLLSLMLAAAMVLSIGAMTVSAADINYPVAVVWNTGFLKDEDGVLDIGDGGSGYSSDDVPYGSTVYFPLINKNYEKHNELVKLENAKEALAKAEADYAAALKPYEEAVTEATNAVSLAQGAYDTAKQDADDAEVDYNEALDKYNKALKATDIKRDLEAVVADDGVAKVYETKAANKSVYESKLSAVRENITKWKFSLDTLNTYLDSNNESYYVDAINEYYAETGNSDLKINAIIDYLTGLNTNFFDPDYTIPTLAERSANVVPEDAAAENAANAIDAITNFETFLNTVKNAHDTALGSDSLSTLPADESKDFYQWENYYEAQLADIASAAVDVKSAIEAVNTEHGTTYDVNTTSVSTINGWISAIDTTADVNALKTDCDSKKATFESLSGTASTKKGELEDANDFLDKKQKALIDAPTSDPTVKAKKEDLDEAKDKKDKAEDAVGSNTNVFVFVTESAAVSNAKVKAEWDYGSKYVDKIELDKVKAISSTGDFGLSSSTKSIYCIAVTLEDSKSTNEVEVEGEIAISKSGSNGYSLAETAARIYLTVGAPVADPDSEITATPQLFEEDYSFDAEEDHIFYFEEDSSSWFEVNTKSQKDIVLAFDTEWDEDLADEIFEKNPNADLDFYNGNYAKFSKTGTLWLGYPEDDAEDAYVYAISSSGKLSLVNADYDEYEEAFEIRTNTLGRYVIATEKLKSVGTSSSGSGSGTGTGTGTGTVTASKSSATTPVSSSKPASSKPASSTPVSSKPASSAPASSQVSSQESSKESKPSSEPLSIKEPSSEEDNKYVSGTTDPKDEDVPTKKGGVSWIVWLLILAGLVAVVIAVGVIFYTKKNSGRRML